MIAEALIRLLAAGVVDLILTSAPQLLYLDPDPSIAPGVAAAWVTLTDDINRIINNTLTELADMTDSPISQFKRLGTLVFGAIADEFEKQLAAREPSTPPNVVPLRPASPVISAVGVAGPDVSAMSMAEHALRNTLQAYIARDAITQDDALIFLNDWRKRVGLEAEETQEAGE